MSFNPSRVAGLWLWTDSADLSTLFQDTAATQPVTAAGQPVRRWGDKSRNYWSSSGGNDLTYSAATPPTYLPVDSDGLPALSNARFTSTNSADGSFDRGVSVYAVVDDSATAANTFPWYCASTPGYFGNYHNNTNHHRQHNLSGLTSGTIDLAYITWRKRIEHVRYDGSKVYTQTVQSDTRSLEGLGAVIPVTASTGALQLTGKFCVGYQGTDPVTGSYKELIVYNRCPTDAEHQQIMDYLAAKWLVTNKPLLMCIGDSRMATNATAGADAPWKQLQAALGSGWQAECDAYPGRNIYMCWAELAQSVRARTWPRSSGYQQVALLAMGANDVSMFNNPPLNPADYYAEFADIGMRLNEMGYAVVPCTLPDRGDVNVTAKVNAFNTALRANWRSFGLALSDRAAIPQAQDYNNPVYWEPTKVHWYDPLVQLIVACDLAAIRSVPVVTAASAALQRAFSPAVGIFGSAVSPAAQ